jgi:hypothetical protein
VRFQFDIFDGFQTTSIGTAEESIPRIATKHFSVDDQESPKSFGWWKSCFFASEGSRDSRETPGFFEISSKENQWRFLGQQPN